MGRANKYIFALIWSLPAVALFFLLISIGWPAHVIQMLRTVGLCFGFASIAGFVYRRIPVIGVAVFAGLSSMLVFGFMPSLMSHIFWFLVVVFAISELIRVYKDFSWRYFLIFVGTTFTSIVILFPYFSFEYSQPFNEVRLVTSGTHFDTLYHVAIAAMLKTHHVVSHGLHGLGQLDYHFGSHLLMSAGGKLAGLSMFESYNYLYVFLCPSLLGVMALSVAEEFLPSTTDLNFVWKLLTYGFLLLGTAVLITGSLLYRFALWPSFFESESYLVSLILLLSLISVLHAWASFHSKWFGSIIICAVLAFVTLSKISTGFIALSLVGAWALLTAQKWHFKIQYKRWGVFLGCAVIFLIFFRVINPGMSDAQIEPFQFLHYVKFSGPFWLKLILFIFIHFMFPILVLVFYFAILIMGNSLAVFPRWWALGTIISLAIGIIILLSFYFEGGAGYYFSNISMFLALPVLICVPQVVLQLWRDSERIWTIPRKTVFVLFSALVAVCASGLFFNGSMAIFRGGRTFMRGMGEPLPSTALAGYVEKLRVIRDDPGSLNGVVYIPRTETGYWASMYVRNASYFIPAISERPALYAWPSKESYSFLCGPRYYSNGLCEKSQGSFSDLQLLSEANRMGFNRVYIVTSKGIRNL